MKINMELKQNVGIIDKIIRIILGVLILSLGIIYNNWWGLVGLIPLATGLAGWCPIYSFLKISTCKK
ncbi:MAG: DUF2892 domain-containing protein [Candidatus Pacearchaeota archaeon]|jgi:hypothetical protein